MLPCLSYWMIVLEPPAPVESAPLPYSTKNVPFAVVMKSGPSRQPVRLTQTCSFR